MGAVEIIVRLVAIIVQGSCAVYIFTALRDYPVLRDKVFVSGFIIVVMVCIASIWLFVDGISGG